MFSLKFYFLNLHQLLITFQEFQSPWNYQYIYNINFHLYSISFTPSGVTFYFASESDFDWSASFHFSQSSIIFRLAFINWYIFMILISFGFVECYIICKIFISIRLSSNFFIGTKLIEFLIISFSSGVCSSAANSSRATSSRG